MSEETNPPAKPDSENASPAPDETKKPELTPEQKDAPPAEPAPVAPAPSAEKPAIQVGNEQFTNPAATPGASPSAESGAEAPEKEKEESGPRKILEELEKDSPPQADTPVEPAKEESISLSPDVVNVSPAAEAISIATVSPAPASVDELVTDAMRRLDEILRKIREER